MELAFNMKFKIKCFIYSLFNWCVLCGKRRENHPNCYHCREGAVIIYAQARLCHYCSKRVNFAKHYSMSEEKMLKSFTK